MTVNRGLFVRQNGAIGTTPKEARLAMAGLVAENAPGVPRQGLLFQSNSQVVSGTGSMAYSVAACNPVIERVSGEGVYTPTLTGTTTVATDPAPGSGSRYDLIWVKQNDVDKLDPDNLAVVGVTVGTASTSPAKPTGSVPAGALILAEALVQTGATSTSAAEVTITQVWRHTVARGGQIPVRNSSELAEITGYTGLIVTRLDMGQEYIYRNGSWQPLGVFAQAAGVTSFTMSGNSTTKQVSFPAGRFTQPPILTLGKAMSAGGKIVFAAVNVTTTGFTMYAQTADGSSTSIPVGVEWAAVQISATSGAG